MTKLPALDLSCNICLNNSSICFADSIVMSGKARAIAIAVGDFSTAATTAKATDDEIDIDDNGHDLAQIHADVLQGLFVMLILICGLLIVHSAMSLKTTWEHALNIALVVLVYGFPYILAIPALWSITLRNSAGNFLHNGNIDV